MQRIKILMCTIYLFYLVSVVCNLFSVLANSVYGSDIVLIELLCCKETLKKFSVVTFSPILI